MSLIIAVKGNITPPVEPFGYAPRPRALTQFPPVAWIESHQLRLSRYRPEADTSIRLGARVLGPGNLDRNNRRDMLRPGRDQAWLASVRVNRSDGDSLDARRCREFTKHQPAC